MRFKHTTFSSILVLLFSILTIFLVLIPNEVSVKAQTAHTIVDTVGKSQNYTLIPTSEDGYNWKTANASC